MVEIPQRRRIEPQRLTYMHAYSAAAQTVSGRLAFGHIECIAERAHDFRQEQATFS